MPNAFQFRSLLGRGPAETDRTPPTSAGGRHDSNAIEPIAATQTSRATRSLQVRENLDQIMRQIEHARHDADQMMEEMAALEVDAGQVASLKRENDVLREKLDTSSRETMAEASKAESAGREISRLKDELDRIRQDYEKSQREANANALDAERIEDRLRTTVSALDEAKRDLETMREAREKAEVEAACLRANLTERDRAQGALMQSEAELRLQTAKLQTRYEEVTDALARKERSVLEKSAELESSRDRIADLEAEAASSRDELRVLNNKLSDLRVSQDARIYSLNDGLDQERESHRMTRKLLEEERAKSDDLIDEITSHKDQTAMASKDTQKMKRELTATRTQVHEYGDKLKEAHLQYAAAQSDIQRLEAALEDAKKDATSLGRQANKSDQLLRENTDLHDKVSSLQQRIERYRGKDLLDDAPIMLSSASRRESPSRETSKANVVATSTPNVARIRRR